MKELDSLEQRLRPTHVQKHKDKVIFVDDNIELTELLKRYVEKHFDLEVLTAETGEEGLKLIREHGDNCIYVCLDVVMPGMNGFEVYEIARKEFPDLPMGFLTAFPGREKQLRDVAKIHGFFDYHVKGADPMILDNMYKTLTKVVAHKEQAEFEKAYIRKGAAKGKLIYTLIGGEIAAVPYEHRCTKLVTSFNDKRTVIGAMVDADDSLTDLALRECHAAAEHWSKADEKTYLRLMQAWGSRLFNDNIVLGRERLELLEAICHTNLAAYSIVRQDMKKAGIFAARTKEYKDWAHRHIDGSLADEVKTAFTAIQSSMYQTGAYGIIEGLRAKKSLIVKLDSKDPYSQYHVCAAFIDAWKEMQEKGEIGRTEKPPLQVLAWDTGKHMDRGSHLISETDATIFMGSPENAILAEHGMALRNIHLSDEDDIEKISALKREQMQSPHVIYYTANKAGGFIGGVKSREALNTMLNQAVASTISHYRSCKRLITLVIDNAWHPDAPADLQGSGFYSYALNMLKDKFSGLRVGETGEKDAMVVRVNEAYWNGVLKYLRDAESSQYGRVIRCGTDVQAPRIIELDPAITDVQTPAKGIQNYLSSECMFPVLNVVRGSERTAKDVARLMHSKGDSKNLEWTVWTQEPGIFRSFTDHNRTYRGHGTLVTSPDSYGLYLNERTTDGLGTFSKAGWKKRGHQQDILYLRLRTMEKNPTSGS